MNENYAGNTETVFSEMVYVKRELLQSFFNATKELGAIARKRSINSSCMRRKMAFIMYSFNLYQKLSPFFSSKKLSKESRKISEWTQKVEDSVITGKNISFEDWYSVFKILRIMLYDLGVLRIGIAGSGFEISAMEGIANG